MPLQRRWLKTWRRKAVAVALVVAMLPLPALAEPGLIRDAEIEHNIRTLATPIFAAAGLTPSSVEINLVDDKGINAFVAGGQRVFLNTGLILAARDPLEIAGVIAHETGHIAGGHLARTQEALAGATAQMVLAYLLGAAAMVGGNGDAGAAIVLGGGGIAQRTLLRYSRAQESAADQAGLSFLIKAGYSPRGLLSFMELLGQQDGLLEARQDPYLLSHPIFPERIGALRDRVAAAGPEKPLPPGMLEAFARSQAKIFSFTQPLGATLRKYPLTDTRFSARYARAIAYHRVGRTDDALGELEPLLAANPSDAYVQELRGQILLEQGRVAEATESYARAVALAPDEPLIRLGYGSALVATNTDPARVQSAVEQLRIAVNQEPTNAEGWRVLATAFGYSGDVGQAALASAEQNMLGGNHREALRFAEMALRRLDGGSPGWLRAQDIKRIAEERLKKG
jgi:predicted Zn-dependent protease